MRYQLSLILSSTPEFPAVFLSDDVESRVEIHLYVDPETGEPQKAIRAAGLRNAGRRADEARRLSVLELLASWEPLDEDFPEIEDPPLLDEGIFADG